MARRRFRIGPMPDADLHVAVDNPGSFCTVVLVPGFMSDRDFPLDRWSSALRGVTPAGARALVYRWRSGKTPAAWNLAETTVPAAAVRLAEWIPSSVSPVVLVGHSLGGYLVLRAAAGTDRTHDEAIQGVISLAAATDEHSAGLGDLRHLRRKPELVYSENDSVLAHVYKLGSPFADAPLGLRGAPRRWRRYVTNRNMSFVGGTPVGHGCYQVRLDEILGRTTTWTSMVRFLATREG